MSARPTSARGLFRATGKKAKAKPHLIDDEIVVTDAPLRREADFYPTRDPNCVRALVHAEGARLRSFGAPIWEAAVGEGHMQRDLEALGFAVIGSDLFDRGIGATVHDFFAFTAPLSPVLVTNPPFSKVNWAQGRGRWITHARDVLRVPYMALLLSWSFPGAAGLATVWDRDRPARAYLMRWKVDFTGEGAPPNLNGWYVWDGHATRTDLLMMDRVDPAQASLFDEAAP